MSGEVEQIDLDQLIEERMKEKRAALKEKLEIQLKTIRARRVPGVNHEPFPEGAFERLTCNRIWEKVLDYVTTPSDVTSAYFACRTFAEILNKRYLLLMLPKVLNVCWNGIHFDQTDDESRVNGRRIRNDVCLSFRQVCKAWKEVADFELFDSDFSQTDWFMNVDWIQDHDFFRSRNVCELWNEDDVDREMSYFNSHILAPTCVIRNLHLRPDYYEVVVDERYSGKVIEFLRIHGRAVRSFYFRCDRPRDIAVHYGRLCEMLECVPNLKVLVLNMYTGVDAEEDLDEDFGNLQQRLMEQRPFPILNSLEHFISERGTDDRIFPQILRKCVNLRGVSYSTDQIVTDEVNEALMELCLERFQGSSEILMSNQVAWPLKHLTIDFESYYLVASELFPAINSFRETLQYLKILEIVKMDADNVRLDLPHLKSLSLKRWIRKGTLGFNDLLNLTSLEVIEVDGMEFEDENSQLKIKRYLDTGKLEKSDVWKCFPNLLRFECGKGCGAGRVYYRPTLS